MPKKAVVRTADGLVENVIVAEDDFDPGEDYELIDAEGETVSAGWTWDGTNFIEPPEETTSLFARPGVVDAETFDLITEQFRAAGSNAIQAENAIAANDNIPQEVDDFARASTQMFYLLYVALTGDRIDSVEADYFPVE